MSVKLDFTTAKEVDETKVPSKVQGQLVKELGRHNKKTCPCCLGHQRALQGSIISLLRRLAPDDEFRRALNRHLKMVRKERHYQRQPVGRPVSIDPEVAGAQARLLKAQGKPLREIAALMGISSTTVFKLLQQR